MLAIMLRVPLLFRCFYMGEASIVYEFYSGGKQNPQNFQHHKNGRTEIAACNA